MNSFRNFLISCLESGIEEQKDLYLQKVKRNGKDAFEFKEKFHFLYLYNLFIFKITRIPREYFFQISLEPDNFFRIYIYIL